MEPEYSKQYHIHDCDVDRFGRLLPSRVLFYAQDTAGAHCDLLGLPYEVLESKRLFWAVIRHRVQVTRWPRQGENITVKTWPMPTTRSAYPRSTVAYDQQGNELFRAISLWVLMNMDTRAMVLPGKSGVEVNGVLLGSELAPPGSMALTNAPGISNRTVAYTDLDRNGHMNNCRCLDWIADLLPSSFFQEHVIREFTVCYLSEAREGQLLQLCMALSDGPQLAVDALRQESDLSAGHSRVFSVRVLF